MTDPQKRRGISWWVALRAFVWSIAFAGTVVGYIPWRFFGVTPSRARPAGPSGVAGLLAVAVGTALMLACIAEFVVSGQGTPAPMDPPRELVVRGPYRFVRNPMYLGAMLALLGELSLVYSRAFAVYILSWFACIHLVVVLYEEPRLRRVFGGPYERYTADVGRWWPRVRRTPATPSDERPPR